MAETWVKVRHALVRSAKIRMLMRELKCNKATAIGVALQWFVWIDEQTEDGKTNLTPDELADEIGFRGCTEALVKIGWAALDETGCVCAVDFGKHCGETAKARAVNAQRVARFRRKPPDGNGECNARCNGKSVTGSVTNVTPPASPEERREEENNKKRVGGLSNGGSVAGVEKPPPPPPKVKDDCAFGEWKAALCRAVPALAEYEMLPPDVEAAAARAYKALPGATKYEQLLAAYYADRLQEDARRRRFWRPTGELFFDSLSDVIHNHAERWALETGWKRRKKSAAAAAAEKVPPPDAVSRKQWAEFKAEMKEHLFSPEVEGKPSTCP